MQITYADQQKINRFAKYNAKVEDFKEELKYRQGELVNIEEAVDELELADDDADAIPFLMGEVFILNSVSKTQEFLQKAKEQKINEIKEYEMKSKELLEIMSDLKASLYGKFGSHIYLENDDE